MDFTATASSCVLVALSIALKIGRMPTLAPHVRRLRPILTFLAIQAWIVLRLVPNMSPKESILQIAARFLKNLEHTCLTSVKDHGYPWLGTIFHWTWRFAEDVMFILLCKQLVRVVYCLYHYSVTEWMDLGTAAIFRWAKKHVPGVQATIDQQTEAFTATADQVLNRDPKRVLTLQLPSVGRGTELVCNELSLAATTEHEKWRNGKISGTVYTDDLAHSKFMSDVFSIYQVANQLHPGVWYVSGLWNVRGDSNSFVCAAAMLHPL
jgi:hypothetical protein